MPENENVLVVDDESLIRDYLKEILKRMGCSADEAVNGKEAIEKLKNSEYDIVITDIRMPEISGMDVLKEAKISQPSSEILMITAFGTIENAVEAMKMGAYDYITKESSLDHIELIVKKAIEHHRLKNENRYLRSEIDGLYGFDNIVGRSAKMQKIFDMLKTVAESDATVFIQGPSGTGKELIAHAIHYNSPRRDKPFIKTNCAALPEGLMESELFGHEKGAFTGAIKARKGRFEAAHTGTLLLDEVSEMSAGLQAKLLRVLQEKEFERVGNTQSIKVDVRIIATTNKDIKEEIKKERFREDLYFRINVIPIHVAPLRERKKDIPLLVEHFIRKYNKEHNREIRGISREAESLLMRLDWSGNVRELENRIERAVIISKEPILQIRHFLFEEDGFDQLSEFHSEDTQMTLRELEKQQILKTLKNNDFNRTKTAEILDISVRTLRNKLNEYKAKGELDSCFLKEN